MDEMDEKRSFLEARIGQELKKILDQTEELDYSQEMIDSIPRPDFKAMVAEFKRRDRQRRKRRIAIAAVVLMVATATLTPVLFPQAVEAGRAWLKSIYKNIIQNGYVEMRPNGIPAEGDDDPVGLTYTIGADELDKLWNVIPQSTQPETPKGFEFDRVEYLDYIEGGWEARFIYRSLRLPDEAIIVRSGKE